MTKVHLSILAFAATAASSATAANPIFTDRWTADPAPFVEGGRIYVYTGHDNAQGNELFTMPDWVCYSSTDLKTWTNHGVLLRPTDFPFGKEKSAWAAQVVKKGGKYYWYATMINTRAPGAQSIGVAVADSPLGPWKAQEKPVIVDTDTPSPYWGNDIDPSVFVDEDGTGWLVWGNPVCYIAKLKPDMLSVDGEIRAIPLPNYTEGPWLDKRGGTYYIIYPSRAHQGFGEHLDYASAPSPEGPWTYRGRLTGGAMYSYTIHPGLAHFKGRDILFYHNATLTLNGVGGATGRRCVTAEWVEISPKGPIKPFVQTKEGLDLPPPAKGAYTESFRPVAAPGTSAAGFRFSEDSVSPTPRGEIGSLVKWRDGAAYRSVERPFMESSQCDGFNMHGRKDAMSETFRLDADLRLSRIDLYLTDGEGTDKDNPLRIVLRKGDEILFDVPVDYVPQGYGLASLAIDRAHQALLKAGTEYVLELRGRKGSAVAYWRRGWDGKKPHAFALYGEPGAPRGGEKSEAGVVPPGVRNPVIWADVPDPSVCCDGTYYYMVSTTMHFMPGAPIMRSKDMVRWETVSHVFPRLDDHPAFSLEDPSGRTMYGQGQWATSIRYHNGRFYIWFVCNGFRGFIYTAERAEGPWRLHSRPQYRHDGSLFFDDDGKAYVFHGSGSVSELNEDLSDFKKGGLNRTVVVRDADEQALLEGSSVFKENGWYYLMMISMKWGEAGRFRREVCYRSRTLDSTGWEKKILIETPFDGHGGVGQGGVVKGPDGKYRAIIFQDRGGVGRTPNYLPVCWEDGWPMLGLPGADSKALGVKSGAARIVPNDTSSPYPDISGICSSDSFDGDVLKQVWEWNHNPVDSAWSLSARRGWLRLTTPRVVPNLFLAPNTLTMRMVGPECAGVIRMDVSGMKDGDRAGLAAFQSDSAVLQVAMDGGRKRIVMAEERMKMDSRKRTVLGDDVKEVESVPLDGNIVYFRVRADFRAGQDWAETDWSADGKTWRRIGSRMPLRFDFTRFFTGSRFGIFNYSTKASGGHVDIDAFDFTCKGHE